MDSHSDHMNHMNHMDHMDSSNHMDNHSAHHQPSGSHEMPMMKPFFHFGFGDTILFEEWTINNGRDVFIACVAFFVIAIVYEFIKRYREFLFRSHYNNHSYQISVIGNQTNGNGNELNTNSCEEVILFRMWSWAHFIQSILHMVQVFTSFTLMLGFMTFNIWLCLSIILGAGVGYFLFCWKKITIVNATEHCH